MDHTSLDQPNADTSLAQKRAQLRALLHKKAAQPRYFPLSFAQQRLWFLHQLAPESPFYTIARTIFLSGPLQLTYLEQSLNELVRRHETLRTRFVVVEDEAVQVIDAALQIPLPTTDLSALSETAKQEQVLRLAREESLRPFDLARGPLLRAYLLRLKTHEHVLLLSMHHCISDGWSMGIFFRELGTLYNAFGSANPSPLPALPLQYADYTLWQRKHLTGSLVDEQLRYWKKQLEHVPQLTLPTDRLRPMRQTFAGAYVSFSLAPGLVTQLRALSQREGTTLFMTLLAAFQILLARYSGQEDIVLGTPIVNRPRSELDGLIGFFANMLVLRTDLSGDPSFYTLLKRVREVALGAYAHQDLPIEYMLDELGLQRDLSRNPLFQVVISLHNASLEELTMKDLTLHLSATHSGTAKFDLSFLLQEEEHGAIQGVVEYSTDLFEASTIEGMLNHYQQLLERIVDAPEQRISTYSMLTETERQHILNTWSHTSAPALCEACLHTLFEEQVTLQPDAIALVWADAHLTYHELNLRANRLAHALRDFGVGPEVPVGLCLQRSLDLLVALLAILKAGGVFVPLDPHYPPARLAFLLEDAQPCVVLSTHPWIETLPTTHGHIIDVQMLQATLVSGPTHNLELETSPHNLAAVLYTSGSTGIPKGVGLPHLGMVRLVKDASYAHLSPSETFLQASPLSFDASTFEIWGCLLNGGRLVLSPPEQLSLAELAALLLQQHVTTLWLTAGLFHQMVEYHLSGLRSVRQLLAGGDVLALPAAQTVLRELPACQLINGYGPTENSTFTCCYPLVSTDLRGTSVPIGRPINQTEVYVLDAQMALVPVGVPGELYTGGTGLARGYLGRPDLTAAAFVPHPFSLQPGARLYRTGDLVRYRHDGTLEFLGRKDTQVKIRGFRIELAEIEAFLLQQPGVSQAVVVPHEEQADEKYLVAYVVPHADQLLTGDMLRQEMQAQLPAYLVPASCLVLDALPLTANGKLDRRALPAPNVQTIEKQASSVAPRTPTEELLATLWAELLKVERVGVFENFFELGGHSLLATQIMARVRTLFQVELPLQDLFAHPTVAGLAQVLQGQTTQQTQVVPLLIEERPPYLPLSFAQKRLWFLAQLEAGTPFYNLPTVLRFKGPLQISHLIHGLNALIQRHEILRTHFAVQHGQPVQVIDSAIAIACPVIDLSTLDEPVRETEAQHLAYEEAHQLFDLANGPLLRTALLRLGAEEHIFLLNLHHIIVDGWSLTVFFRELGMLYTAFATQTTPALSVLPLQYTDYVLWQRKWLTGPLLQNHLAYWRKQLSELQHLELPTDYLRPQIQQFQGHYLRFQIPQHLTAELKRFSQREQVTLFMTLFAAFQVLLARYSGQEDIAVGTPIANRAHTELEGLIGFFANTLVLRTDLSGDPTFRELLSRVRQCTLEAYAHQDLPFEKLVEELNPTRSLSHHPLFQVMFALYTSSSHLLELPRVQIQYAGIAHQTSRFDLTFNLSESQAGLAGGIEYNRDLFAEETIQRFIGHYEQILTEIVAHPEQSIFTIPLLTPAEQAQMDTWHTPLTAASHEACLYALFEEQARRTPDAVAVVWQETLLTYGELDRRAQQVAYGLQKRGVGPETRVGICLDRSLVLLIGILGVLKAGGAYVPLDPAYPQERLDYIAQDAQITVLLTDSLRATPFTTMQEHCLTIEELFAKQEWVFDDEQLRTAPLYKANLVYIMYTSGSTGRPKGVSITQQNVVTFLAWAGSFFAPQHLSRVLASTSVCFDVSVFELFVPLTQGGTVLLATDALHISEVATQQAATLLNTVPSVLQEVLRHHFLPTSILTINLAGEPVPPHLVQQIAEQMPWAHIVNLYGPTEDTVYATAASLTAHNAVTIGRPIAQTYSVVLDRKGQPVPVGVPGILFLGGVGLARGYWNQAGLTAERFVPDPFSQEPGARLYNTGDIVRYRNDGALEYIGRADQQIKLHGFRIELEEIETVICQHPTVQQALVRLETAVATEPRLVSYVVLDQAQDLHDIFTQLRTYLQTCLPAYMIPTAFMAVNAFPLMPNGKLDWRALPHISHAVGEHEATYTPPETALEQLIATVWQEVLQLEKVGSKQNFFDLGGHSLLSIRVQQQLRQTLDREIHLVDLFKYPTVHALAQYIDSVPNSAHATHAISEITTRARQQKASLRQQKQKLQTLRKNI